MPNILGLLFQAIYILIFARIIVSWVAPRSSNPIVQMIYQLTEPMLAPFRRMIPPTGGFDLSPMILLILLSFAQRLLV